MAEFGRILVFVFVLAGRMSSRGSRGINGTTPGQITGPVRGAISLRSRVRLGALAFCITRVLRDPAGVVLGCRSWSGAATLHHVRLERVVDPVQEDRPG